MSPLIVFDLDGVLIDSRKMYIELVQRVLQEHDFSKEDVENALVASVPGTIRNLIGEKLHDR